MDKIATFKLVTRTRGTYVSRIGRNKTATSRARLKPSPVLRVMHAHMHGHEQRLVSLIATTNTSRKNACHVCRVEPWEGPQSSARGGRQLMDRIRTGCPCP